ncbi:hypothetical protein, partial [Haemophilus parainfluenzae]|uniref:hypothetical protein n=1 Tax=Haemophilus parainfluenzae TaxID=729 RepID=UPI001CECE83F
QPSISCAVSNLSWGVRRLRIRQLPPAYFLPIWTLSTISEKIWYFLTLAKYLVMSVAVSILLMGQSGEEGQNLTLSSGSAA